MFGKWEDENLKKRLMDAAGFIGFIIVGALAGISASGIQKELYGGKATGVQSLVPLVIALFIMVVMFFVHIIIHEGGHLLFGWLSGYRFSSFRIANIILANNDGKLQIKKYSIPGTGGQCLMIPPKEKGEEVPFVLYNLGGVLTNLITAMIALIALLLWDGNAIVRTILSIFSATGFVQALQNGIPMTTKQVANDGMNILKLKKNPKALKAFVNTFYIHEQTTMGKRLRDMPEKYFEICEGDSIMDSISVTVLIYRFMRLIDLGKIDEAMKLGEELLDHVDAMAGIHANMVKLELMYCRILSDYPKEKIDELYEDKEVKAFLKVAGRMISTPRYQYAYALLVERDERKAEKYYNDFYRILKNYPYKADAETEEELLLMAKGKQC